MRTLFFASSTFLGLVFSTQISYAAVQATVKIEQVSPSQVGAWTFLLGDGSSRSSSDAGIDKTNHSFSVTEFGPMTISVVSPQGMSPKINIYRNGQLSKTETVPQFSFTPYPNESYRFLVQYSYSRMGNLGVTSNPSNIRFRMKSASGKAYTATSPHTFQNLPAGRYTLYFPSTPECVSPAPHSVAVEPETRNTANVSLTCTAAVGFKGLDKPHVSKRSLMEAVKARELKARGQCK